MNITGAELRMLAARRLVLGGRAWPTRSTVDDGRSFAEHRRMTSPPPGTVT